MNPQVAPTETHPCVPIVQELWPILDTLADRVGGIDEVARPLAGCWRSTIISYRTHYAPLLPTTMARLIKSFEQTGLGQYLWVASRIVREFGESSPAPSLQLVESLSVSMWRILQKYSGQFNEIPDGRFVLCVPDYLKFPFACRFTDISLNILICSC